MRSYSNLNLLIVAISIFLSSCVLEKRASEKKGMIAPTISAPSLSLVKNGPVTFTVNYSFATKISLKNSDVLLYKTGTANGSIAVSGTGTSSRIVTISNISGDGTLGISIAANSASDYQEKTAPASGVSPTFTVDNTPPSINITPSTSVTKNGPVVYTINYTGASSITLSTADIILDKTGSAYGKISLSGSGPTTRTLTISEITGNGTLSLLISPNSAKDAVGNLALSFETLDQVIVDNIPPSLTISSPSLTLTNTGPVVYTINYSDASSISLSNADITLNKTGTANGSIAVTGTGNTTRYVTISNITGDGTLGISIASNTASDDAINFAASSGTSESFTVNNAQPFLTISAPAPTLAHTGPVVYTINYFNASSITLSNADITLNKTGTANGSVAVSGTGSSSRAVTISGITGNGTLGITIAANTASDTGGNLAPAPSASSTVDIINTEIQVSWDANREQSVNQAGGGYKVYYSTTPGLDISTASFVDVPYISGPTAPTSINILNWPAGTYYFKIVAYSALNKLGGSTGSTSSPSSEFSVSLP